MSRDNIFPGDPDSGWDGTFKGSPVQPGVYVYAIRALMKTGDVIIRTGDVTVIR